MSQKLVQNQNITQTQQLTPQQLQLIKLLELPLADLEARIKDELMENAALEENAADRDDEQQDENTNDTENYEESGHDERQDYFSDDDVPDYVLDRAAAEEEKRERIFNEGTSFYESLKNQIGEQELTPKQEQLVEYLIGSLDDDGLLRKDTGTLSDELAIYHNVDASEKEIDEVLRTLQTFDPAGIGARDLRECLLLQIRRKPASPLRQRMEDVVAKCFDEFMNKRWDKIKAQLGYDDDTADKVHAELLRLNPKPGSALGETEGRGARQITPDFIVDTADDGTVTFTINGGNVPELYISPSFASMVDAYRGGKGKMNRQEKEALLYAKEKVERARGFIDAVKQRQHTLYVTMKAIIDIQKRYFQDGDESDLKPMILKDVAEKTGLDISTVSRVSNMKYAQTRWGTFRLRHFFSDSVKTEGGEEMSTRRIKAALKDIIDKEDKASPLSDDAITAMMKAGGYPVARRTIAKYREQMGIPIARLRKK